MSNVYFLQIPSLLLLWTHTCNEVIGRFLSLPEMKNVVVRCNVPSGETPATLHATLQHYLVHFPLDYFTFSQIPFRLLIFIISNLVCRLVVSIDFTRQRSHCHGELSQSHNSRQLSTFSDESCRVFFSFVTKLFRYSFPHQEQFRLNPSDRRHSCTYNLVKGKKDVIV